MIKMRTADVSGTVLRGARPPLALSPDPGWSSGPGRRLAGGRCKAPVPRECSENLFLLLFFLLLLFLFFFLLAALLLLLLLFLLFFLAGARWLV